MAKKHDNTELKTCENCKHWSNRYGDVLSGVCEKLTYGTKGWVFAPPHDFGCVKFEKGKHEI